MVVFGKRNLNKGDNMDALERQETIESSIKLFRLRLQMYK